MPLPKSIKFKAPKKTGPVWRGPEKDGITFSLLTRFLTCRERFRVLVVEGLRPTEGFNHRIEFGNMWHVCEEAAASERSWSENELRGIDTTAWEDSLKEYVQNLLRKYPLSQDLIAHWYGVCRTQFPLYVKYWADHPDVKDRTPLLQEQTFDVPYKLSSGRVVRLRGKWDSVDLIGKGKGAGIYLQENKTKSRIDEQAMKRQLTFDLQTMLYTVALYESQNQGALTDVTIRGPMETMPSGMKIIRNWKRTEEKIPILGVCYNVVRRTEHRVGKKETEDQFLDRLRGIMEETPSDWFMRWRVEVSPADVTAFRRRCLDPILESLCDWWDWIKTMEGEPFDTEGSGGIHWQHPFGSVNWIDEAGGSDLDEYLLTGSTAGLTKVDELFPELNT